MADVKIRDLPQAITFSNTDLFIIEQQSGTFAIPTSVLLDNYATKSYVSSALSGYATETYVQNYVQNYINNLDAREVQY